MIAVNPSTWTRKPLRNFNLGTIGDRYHSYHGESQSPALRDGIPSPLLMRPQSVFTTPNGEFASGDFYCPSQQVFESNNRFYWEVCLTSGSVYPGWNLSNAFMVKSLELFA